MASPQYASLAGAVTEPIESDFRPDTTSIARRSVSIFSRRGTATPEPKPALLTQATSAMSRSPTKKMTDRQQSWLRRRSLDIRKPQEAQLQAKGTILNAVPPAERIQMTRLEAEMATGPNEEIMSAISEHPPTRPAWAQSSDPAAQLQLSPFTSQHIGNEWHHGTVHRTESAKRRDTNTRIGVWVDGVTHWDEGVQQTQSPSSSHKAGADLVVQDHAQAEYATTGSASKPNLKVTIPYFHPFLNDRSPKLLMRPQPQRHTVTISHVNDKQEALTPCIVVEDFARDGQRCDSVRQSPIADSSLAEASRRAMRASLSTTASSSEKPSDASVYSKRSSTTSIEPTLGDAADNLPWSIDPQHEGSIPTIVPSTAEICETTPHSALDIHKPLPRVPVPRNMRKAPAPPSGPTSQAEADNMHISRSAPGSKRTGRRSLPCLKPRFSQGSRSVAELDFVDADFIRASPYAPCMSDANPEAGSPTLSQAESDLQAHLGTISEAFRDENSRVNATAADYRDCVRGDAEAYEAFVADATDISAIRRTNSVHSVMQPPARAPTLPKRSRKRDWQKSSHAETTAATTVRPPPKAPGRRKSDPAIGGLTPTQETPTKETSNVHRSESEKVPTRSERRVVNRQRVSATTPYFANAPNALDDHDVAHDHDLPAEQVLLHILSALTSTQDLFNMSVINKGMYRVFKENEEELCRIVASNQSNAGWELREWRSPQAVDGSSKVSYTYAQRRDEKALEELQKLVLQYCQTFIRRETALAFAHLNHPHTQRFTDAFWRIWTFCTIFGSRKNREEDITGQLDWLKGGLLANNQTFSATVNTNLEFDMGSVLLNAPEYFAQGNKGGLSAAQLYDMTELWNCLGALLAGYLGQIEEARRYGIFANCGVEEGDVESEGNMLEEWVAFVMTLGPDVVLDLSRHAIDDPAAGFELAKGKGWTDWTPAVTGSRTTFMKEPVARLYEERISAASLQMQDPHDLEKKETARKRVATLAAEIRLRRQTSGYKRLPMIDMHSERAMSMVSRRSSVVPQRSAPMVQTSNLQRSTRYYAYSTQSAQPPPPSSQHDIVSPLNYTPTPSSTRAPSAMSNWSSRHIISPIKEGRVEAFNRLTLANLDGAADSTVERAVRKITEMGFTEAQATHALRMTDMGDGLRVDRAVDMLLRT